MPNKYRVAVVGSTGRGDYGHALDTAWLAVPQTEVLAVADPNKDGAAAAARRLGITRTFTDYRQMFDAVKPDIAAIAPRWLDQHRDMCLAAAERGIHIYLEKPFCRTLQEADEIVAACERRQVKLAVAYPTRYSPKLATIRQLIADGQLGRVLEYRARGKEDRRGGGEDLWVLGSHVLDMIHALAGRPQWCQATLKQQGQPVTRQHVVEGNEGIGPLAGDEVHARFGLTEGATAYFASRRNAGGNPSRYALQIFGTAGVLELLEAPMPSVKFLPDPAWSPGRSGKAWLDVSSAGIDQSEPLTGEKYTARHTLAILDLLDAIERDRQPLASAYAARDVTEMIVSVFESHRVGGPVELPLKNRRNPLTMLT